MIVTLGNLYYYPLKLYVYLASYLYFRKLRVVGRKNIPAKGPLIYAINHQNALLDALLLSVVTIRNPHFLTRADVFNNKFIDNFLRGLKMLPIYRMRDGYDSIKRNDATFASANEILQNGGVVGIFPEGSHSLKYTVRPLKKGVARIAFMAEETADFNLNTKIIPVGIQYESHFLPEGRTLISFGEPIEVTNYNDAYRQDKNRGIEQLLTDLRKRMKSLIVNIEGEDYETEHHKFKKKRIFKNNLILQLKADQNLVSAIESGKSFDAIPEKGNLILRLFGFLWRFLWKIIGFIPRKLTDLLVKKTTKDPHFFGTMRFAFSIFGYPIFFWIIYLITRFIIF